MSSYLDLEESWMARLCVPLQPRRKSGWLVDGAGNRIPPLPMIMDVVEQVPGGLQEDAHDNVQPDVAEIHVSEHDFSEIPDSVHDLSEVPDSERGLSEVPDSEQGLSEVPDSEQGLSEVPDSEQGLSEVPDSEHGFAEIPESEISDLDLNELVLNQTH